MDAESHFGIWVLGAALVFLVGGLLFDTLVERSGRSLIRLLDEDSEPTPQMSRAVGVGIWSTIIVIILYAVAG